MTAHFRGVATAGVDSLLEVWKITPFLAKQEHRVERPWFNNIHYHTSFRLLLSQNEIRHRILHPEQRLTARTSTSTTNSATPTRRSYFR